MGAAVLSVYLAASSAEPERVRRWMDAIRESPALALSCDWLTHIEEEQARGRPDTDIPRAEQERYARRDLDAIARSDVFWLLAPPGPVRGGCWVEWGYARALCDATVRHMPMVVSGDPEHRYLFASLSDHETDTDEGAFRLIGWMAGRLM